VSDKVELNDDISLSGIYNKTISEIPDKDSYIASYSAIIFAAKLLVDSENCTTAQAIAHMVYGWMPTIPKSVCSSAFKHCPLGKIQNSNDIDEVLSSFQKSPINGSWIGFSKFLHFINPKLFPIWDRNVAFCFGVKGHSQINNMDRYRQYAKWIESMKDHEDVLRMQEKYKEKYGYRISKTRALEFMLFHYGKKQRLDKKMDPVEVSSKIDDETP